MNPALIEIRRATPNDARSIAEIHVAAWCATYVGIIAQSYLDSLSVEERTISWDRRLRSGSSSRSDIFVAESNDTLFGFVAGGPRTAQGESYDAQLHAIYLTPEAQHQGIGRRLVQHWASAAVDRGLNTAVVYVLSTNNPARRFYERLGARYVDDVEAVIGGERYLEARYCWDDLNFLILVNHRRRVTP